MNIGEKIGWWMIAIGVVISVACEYFVAAGQLLGYLRVTGGFLLLGGLVVLLVTTETSTTF